MKPAALEQARHDLREALAVVVQIVQDQPGVRFHRSAPECESPAELLLGWILFVEGVTQRLASGAARRAPGEIWERLAWAVTRTAILWVNDPALDRATEARGVLLQEDVVKVRAAAAINAVLRQLECAGEQRDAAAATVSHQAFGPLDAAEWSRLFLAGIRQIERKMIRHLGTGP